MKILLVVHGFPPECSGGTEAYVLRLAKELVELGHRVEVLTGSHQGRPEVVVEASEHEGILVHKLHRSGLFVDDWDKSFAPEIEPAVASVVARFRPDLVHVHHWIRLSRHLVETFHRAGVPALCTLHDLWTTCPIAFRVRQGSFCERPVGAASCHDCAPRAEHATDAENAQALELFRDDLANELALARRVVVPSRAHRAAVLAHHPSIAGKVRVVPHGVISDLAPGPRGARRRRPGPLRLGHWGHLSKLKGIDVLLEAAASLPERVKAELELHVFGAIVYPSERPAIEALAQRSRTTLHGAFTPAGLRERDLDFAVLPTRCSESHSFVLDEAFLLGLPAIVPARGALADRIGRAGATFQPESAGDLAKALERIVEDPGVLATWRDAIPRLRSFAAHAREVLGVYREVVGSQAPLPITPQALITRRARLRSLQVETRNRRLEFLEGDERNLVADLARATSTMQEMERHHLEKDKVIASLRGDVAALASDVARATSTMQEMERHHLEKDKVIEGLTKENSEIAGLRTGVATLKGDLARAAALARELERDGRAKDEALARLRDEVTARARAVVALEGDVGRLESSVESHRRERDALAAERATLADELDRSRTRLVRTLASGHAALAALAPAVEGLEARVAAAEADAARAARTPRPGTVPASLVDRLKRTAFGDDRTRSGPLRILYVLHQFLPRHVAGTELYTFNLAREMRARGARVAVLTCEAHHDLAPFEYARHDYEGIPVHEVVHNYAWSSFQETYDSPRADAIFERVLDEERPDVVHVQHLHYFSANFIGIARRRGIPVVYTLHDYAILCARDGQLRRADGELCLDAVPAKCADCIAHHALDPLHVPARDRASGGGVLVPAEARRALRRAQAGLPAFDDDADAPSSERFVEAAAERLAAWRHAVRGVDLFVSPSAFLRDLFVRTGMIPHDRIVVSPNGHDTSAFQAMPERVRGNALRFGYVGSIAEHKGIHVLVEAMNGLADQPAAECRIHGDLTAFVEYTERLRELSRNPRTRFVGPFRHGDVARVLSEIDVLVIPSLWFENAPLTIQEAALSRVPVIASDLGGLAEHVVEGRNGLRFFTGDAEDLRKKILWFLEDFSRCERFDFASVPVVTIRDDAERMERRYGELVAAAGLRSG